MIYQDTKRILKKIDFDNDKVNEWGALDNIQLLNFLTTRYTNDELKSNSSEIKQAFKDFYENKGSIVFRFDPKTGVTFKLFPYRVKAENSKHLNRVIEIIQTNRDSVVYPYNEQKNQIAILGKIRRKINSEISDSDESVNKRELIRYAIKKALQLSNKDIIIQLKRKYIVKIFQKNTYTKINEESMSHENLNTIDLGEYKAYYEEIEEDMNIKEFIKGAMEGLFSTTLDFSIIDNSFYEKKSLSLIKSALTIELHEIFAIGEDESIDGFILYMIRENFIYIHELIAIELLQCVAKKVKNADTFLLYYSGKVYVENGKKYSIPSLVNPDGQQWNAISLKSISTLWLNAKYRLEKQSLKMENIDEELLELEKDFNITEKAYKEKQSASIKSNEELRIKQARYNEVKHSLDRQSKGAMNPIKEVKYDRDASRLAKELIRTQNDILSINKEKEYLSIQYNSDSKRLMDCKRRVTIIKEDISQLNSNLNVKSSSFYSILSSLVNALMQRKKLIQ